MSLRSLRLLFLLLVASSTEKVFAQTFQATQVVHEVKCQSILGIYNQCITIETDRLHSSFTTSRLGGRHVFGRTWATASHCTRVDPNAEKCKQSVFISTDPAWNRIVWGQSNTFLRVYGFGGGQAEGPGHFYAPLGVDITRREGEWHVGFIADSRNNRIVVLAVGYTCVCVRWLGTLDGTESGTRLRRPHDVAWDPAGTWSFADDRVFIADTDNNRIVVYQVNVNPVAGTMSKTYLSAFGTGGASPSQFSGPQGITIRTSTTTVPLPYTLWSSVHISDTWNQRVVLWHYNAVNATTAGDASPVVQSASVSGSEFVGMSRDFYGDIIVADRARDVLAKYANDLTPLSTYGGNPSWGTGNFNDPTDAEVIYHYTSPTGSYIVQDALPYVQTIEMWTSGTGGQLHHLGVDAEQLAASTTACSATFSFLFTGHGDYNVKVKNYAGSVVASWSRAGAASGWRSEYWNAPGWPPGTYSYAIEHRNAYGDETSWRTSNGPSFSQDCFSVTASVPESITESGTYSLFGSSSHAADSWRWDQGYALWSNQQNSSFYVPNDPGAYSIDWQLTARRTSDGVWDSDVKTTYVSIAGDPPPCENPPCMDEARVPGAAKPSGRVPATVTRLEGPKRRHHHLGSGAWIGARAQRGRAVAQFFAFGGLPGATGAPWANALAGDRDARQNAPDARSRLLGRASVTRHALSNERDAYRLHFEPGSAPLPGAFIGLALDPEMGSRSGDDLLSVDEEHGLIWVTDPDSGVLGYVLTDLPAGARVTVRQFSNRQDAWHPDPVDDKSAYAELSAGRTSLTGQVGDVRMVIAIGPVTPLSAPLDIGLFLVRAPSLDALRELVSRGPTSAVALFADDPAGLGNTGIKHFRLTQAPPDPDASPGVMAISPDLVPGLRAAAGGASADATDAGALRDAVRRHGITALAFAVPDGEISRVTIRVYDPAGRLLRVLVSETYDAGAYRVQWDMQDERGRRVAPGVYIAMMEAGGFRGSAKLIVVP